MIGIKNLFLLLCIGVTSFGFLFVSAAEDLEVLTCPALVETGADDARTGEALLELNYEDTQTGSVLKISEISQCSGKQFEIVTGQFFLAERARLNEIKSQMYQDNQTAPEGLAVLATKFLRESAVCHQMICQQILTQCSGGHGPTQAEVFNRSAWCEATKQIFWQSHQQEFSALLNANVQKKRLGLMREKVRWWETAFDVLVLKKMNRLGRALQVVEEKLSNFLASPL